LTEHPVGHVAEPLGPLARGEPVLDARHERRVHRTHLPAALQVLGAVQVLAVEQAQALRTLEVALACMGRGSRTG